VSSADIAGVKAGEIQVTTQVVGFKKLSWSARELGAEPLELPAQTLQTTGY
jgi:hypothetical protein